MQLSLTSFLLVSLGGALGASVRYLFALLMQPISLTIPYGTFASNLAGCFLLGAFAGLAGGTRLIAPEFRLLFATGFCGGFTTMSSFVFETVQFLRDREILLGSLYFTLSLIGSLACFVVGLMAVRAFVK